MWLTDITEHPTSEGKPYLRAVKDVSSSRIVGYSIDERMKSRHAVNALESAVTRRGQVAGCIVHSDHGTQSQSRKFVSVPARHNMAGSIGRAGTTGDNAAMKSSFVLPQKNVLNHQARATQQDLRIATVT